MTVSNLRGKRIGITAPKSYGEFLVEWLEHAEAIPVWAPTISIHRHEQTRQAVRGAIAQIHSVAGIIFTSRNGIKAVAEALPAEILSLPQPFLLGALGRDAQLLNTLGSLCHAPGIQRVIPHEATPKALVTALGEGYGRSLLCPVPRVVGLTEPDVVPDFLRDLQLAGWHPIRVDAYETTWMGDRCAERFCSGLDAWIVTSTAEVEGLIKSFNAMNLDRSQWLENVVVAAHGPVTAKGAEQLEMCVQVMSHDSSSFGGVIESLSQFWADL